MNINLNDAQALFGQRMRDVNTGYTGKATGFVIYNNNKSAQFLVTGIDSTGRPICEWVDVNDCELCTD